MAVDTISQIYPVAAVFVSPSATGFCYSSGNSGINLISQIPRAQTVGMQFSIPRQDIFELGVMNRLDNIIVSPSSVSASLEYLLVDGYAENALGFAANNLQTSFVSGFLDRTTDEKNLFLLLAKEGEDATYNSNTGSQNIIALGNTFITNYTANFAVGQVPKANVSLEGITFASFTGNHQNLIPAISFETDQPCNNVLFSLPTATAYTGTNIPMALRPSEITLSIPTNASPFDYMSGVGQIHINGMSLSIPITRTSVNELGRFWPRAKKYTPPSIASVSIDALAADVTENSLSSLRCNDSSYNFRVNIQRPNCSNTGVSALIYDIKGAKLESRDYNIAVGGQPASVRLNFTTSMAGITPNTSVGVYVSGSYASTTAA